MTFQETAKIMAVFKAAYPRYYANIDVEEARQVTTLWASMLADYSYETVSNAAKALIVSSKFPPTIAEVIEKIQLLTKEPELTEGEAWSMVRNCLLYTSKRTKMYRENDNFGSACHCELSLKIEKK